jgi:asparagine synthetase B (glutamine-hydrolysing)
MCGIFGGAADLIERDAARLLRHRGPDQQGVAVVARQGEREILLGQTRLNVVYKPDVPTPMQKHGATIAFNGEIYN